MSPNGPYTNVQEEGNRQCSQISIDPSAAPFCSQTRDAHHGTADVRDEQWEAEAVEVSAKDPLPSWGAEPVVTPSPRRLQELGYEFGRTRHEHAWKAENDRYRADQVLHRGGEGGSARVASSRRLFMPVTDGPSLYSKGIPAFRPGGNCVRSGLFLRNRRLSGVGVPTPERCL